MISFGVAPAVLGFTLGLRGGWDMVVLSYFVVCGVSRPLQRHLGGAFRCLDR